MLINARPPRAKPEVFKNLAAPLRMAAGNARGVIADLRGLLDNEPACYDHVHRGDRARETDIAMLDQAESCIAQIEGLARELHARPA